MPLRVLAAPNPASPMRWRGLVETGDFYAVEDVNLAGDFDPGRATIFHKPEPDPALEEAGRQPGLRQVPRFPRVPQGGLFPSAPTADAPPGGWPPKRSRKPPPPAVSGGPPCDD